MISRGLGAALLSTAIVLSSGVTGASAAIVYNRGNDTDPTTLDIDKTTTVAEGNLSRDLYEGLLIPDAKANVAPGVAKSWKVSDDGLKYTFTLRDDAKWSNGDPVKASDFVFAFQRLEDPKTAATYANIQYVIKNAEAVNQGKMAPDQLGVKAIDDHTLEIDLEHPTPYFLQLLTHQTALPLHEASLKKYGDQFTKPGNFVTNGAYMLKSFTPNDKIVMVKNPNYWDAKDVKIDQVNYIPFEDRSACLRRFEAGEVQSCSDVPAEQIDYVKKKLGDQLHIAPYLGTYYLPIDTREKVLSDPRVREAMSLVIDRQFLAEKIWRGAMLPGYSMVPPGIANYFDPVYLKYKDGDMLDREDQAKKLLKDAGVKDGSLTVELRYNTSENNKNTMTAVADMLKDIGIKSKLVEMEGTGYFDYLKSGKNYDMARAGWIGDYSDPQNFLFLFETKNKGFNYPHWSDKQYDALMQKAAETGDLHARSKLLSQAEGIFLDKVPAIPILYYSSLSLVSDKLKGWDDNILNFHMTRYMSLEQ